MWSTIDVEKVRVTGGVESVRGSRSQATTRAGNGFSFSGDRFQFICWYGSFH